MNGDQPETSSGNGPPTSTPTVPVALYTDEDTGVVYQWYDNAWH